MPKDECDISHKYITRFIEKECILDDSIHEQSTMLRFGFQVFCDRETGSINYICENKFSDIMALYYPQIMKKKYKGYVGYIGMCLVNNLEYTKIYGLDRQEEVNYSLYASLTGFSDGERKAIREIKKQEEKKGKQTRTKKIDKQSQTQDTISKIQNPESRGDQTNVHKLTKSDVLFKRLFLRREMI